jgi:hypothetical protein
MAYQPIASEYAAVYTLTGPDGAVAVFNDPSSGNYVGALSEITGLDSAEVRESAQELVESDGGAHGAFYFGRRPVVLTARVFGHATLAARHARIDKARRASLALRDDAILKWTPTGAQEVFVPVRRQQPFRESGAWVKELQIPLVAETAVIQSTANPSVAGGVAAENQGNYPAYPIFEITGTSTDPSVAGGGLTFVTDNLNLASGEKVEFDMLNHRGVFTAGARDGDLANEFIDFATTEWPYLPTGSTTFTLSGGGTLAVHYRHTWA